LKRRAERGKYEKRGKRCREWSKKESEKLKRLLYIVLILVFISGCLHSAPDRYINGEIWIRFEEGVNETQAVELIDDYGISIKYSSYKEEEDFFLMRVVVPKGEESKYVELLEQEKIVFSVWRALADP
jgi:hypothetical protein